MELVWKKFVSSFNPSGADNNCNWIKLAQHWAFKAKISNVCPLLTTRPGWAWLLVKVDSKFVDFSQN